MKIHLMGIGGTGMASLAGMLQQAGHQVRGSDQGVYPPMSLLLEKLGIPVSCPYSSENLEPKPDLVVIGNVISRGNPEAEAVLDQDIPYESMAETLRQFFLVDHQSLVVAGTHGKTTTTSLLAWVLESAGLDPSFFVGGKPKNFPQNFKLGKGKYFVLEGDEYDTAFFDKGPKFLHYEPKHILLTSVEFDHADIYENLDQIRESFRKLIALLPESGRLVANLDYAEVKALAQAVPERVLGYTTRESEREGAAVFGKIISSSEETTIEIHIAEDRWQVEWSSPGQHNLSNALAVVALCLHLGLSQEQIQRGLETFSGVARRQDVLGEIGGIKIVDDFAHHPTAVRATLQAIRRQYPERRIWALFEPRSNTSKRDLFQKDYAEAFAGADEIIISDVFMPEKVKNGKVLDTERLVQEIQENTGKPARHLSGAEEILKVLTQEARSGDLILLMSNGDFGGLGPKLLNNLAPRVKAT